MVEFKRPKFSEFSRAWYCWLRLETVWKFIEEAGGEIIFRLCTIKNVHPNLSCLSSSAFHNKPSIIILKCLYKEPKSQNPHNIGPEPNQLKTPTPKTQFKTPKPQPPNHQWAKNEKKNIKINPGKKYSIREHTSTWELCALLTWGDKSKYYLQFYLMKAQFAHSRHSGQSSKFIYAVQ